MKDYKLYFRKSSFKKDLDNGNLLLEIISELKPTSVLEIGVLEGVTSRNICELLNILHKGNFNFTGIDLFGEDLAINNEKEFTPITKKFSNPFKWIYFRIITRMDPHSKKGVEFLLRKFKKNIKIIKGYSDNILKKINLDNVDFVFLDGGHSYETVKKDLDILVSKLKSRSIIICDDYNKNEYGVKKAIDEIKSKHSFNNYGRFAFLRINK